MTQWGEIVSYVSPLPTRGEYILGNLNVQFIKQMNPMINEALISPRLVNTQTVEYLDWCTRLANGSTVTAADVSAVMQQLEDKLLEILSLNAKVVCSPSGLIFRPKVSGSIRQSELKAKLEAKKAAETDPEKAAAIDVNRELKTSDLSISDCTVSIEVVLPKHWNALFQQRATLKRVSKALTEIAETTDNSSESGGSSDNNQQGGQQTGGSTGGGSTTDGDNNGGENTDSEG